VSLVLDSGALIALERCERAMWRRLKAAMLAGDVPLTHGGVVGQAWRARGPRQALLAKALASVDVRALDDPLGRAAGALLAVTGRDDVIDAALALLCEDSDTIVTSDSDDIAALVSALGRHVEVVRA
jgi:hypothetical protein